jgi:hypothetical protein
VSAAIAASVEIPRRALTIVSSLIDSAGHPGGE